MFYLFFPLKLFQGYDNQNGMGKGEVALQQFARIGAYCNESRLTVDEESGMMTRTGEPTEAALKVLIEKMGCTDAKLNKKLLQNKRRSPVLH